MKENNFIMNIHEALLQPVAAFVHCNRQAAAGRRRQTSRKFPRSTRRLRNWTTPMGGVSLKLFYDGITREIK